MTNRRVYFGDFTGHSQGLRGSMSLFEGTSRCLTGLKTMRIPPVFCGCLRGDMFGTSCKNEAAQWVHFFCNHRTCEAISKMYPP